MKPDWSPIFHEANPYIGRLAFLRHGNLTALGVNAGDLLSDEQATLRRILTVASPQASGISAVSCIAAGKQRSRRRQ